MSLVSFSDRLSKFTMILAAAWAFVLTFIIMADITSRGLFNDPLNGTREIVANSIVMIVFLQVGFAVRSRSMLRAEFLIDLFSPRMRRMALALGYTLGVILFVAIFIGSWDSAIEAWKGGEFEGEGALHIPTWPTRFTILFGSALAAVNYTVLAWLDVFGPPIADTMAIVPDGEPPL